MKVSQQNKLKIAEKIFWEPEKAAGKTSSNNYKKNKKGFDTSSETNFIQKFFRNIIL